MSQTGNEMLLPFKSLMSLPLNNSLARISHMAPSSHKVGRIFKHTTCPEGGERHIENHKQHSDRWLSSWIQLRHCVIQMVLFISARSSRAALQTSQWSELPNSRGVQGNDRRLVESLSETNLTLCVNKKKKHNM